MPTRKPSSKSRVQSKSKTVLRNQNGQQGLSPRGKRGVAAKSFDASQVGATPQQLGPLATQSAFDEAHRLSEEASARVAFAHCVVDWPVEDEASVLDEGEANQADSQVDAVTGEANQSLLSLEPTTSQIVQLHVRVEPMTGEAVQPDMAVEPVATQAEEPGSVQAVSAQKVELAPMFVIPVESERAQGNVLPREVVRDAQAHRGQAAPRASRWGWHVWIGAGLGGLLLVAGGAVAGAYSHFSSGNTIAPDVFIAGVPVGGLTKYQAQQRLAKKFGSPRVALGCGNKTVQKSLAQLGASLAIAPVVKQAFSIGRGGSLPSNLMHVYGASGEGKQLGLWLQWNPAKLKTALKSVDAQVAVAPVDARLQTGTDGLEVVHDRAGSAVDLDAAQNLVRRRVRLGAYSLEVPMRRVSARVTAQSLDGRDVQLAQYTTHFDSGLAGRTENIRIACRAIQYRVLMPGEIFSFNSSTGERTARKGYRMAHIFLRQPGAQESEVADGLAGGVCQVSSTLFNAVRKTNAKAQINPIKVVERSSHSLPVSYVPHGLDATVAWPSRDFKFRNVTDHPVFMRAQMGRSKLSISIWGRVPRA